MDAHVVKLSEVAEIQTGYVFRSKIEESPDGNVQVIRNTDLTAGHVSTASPAIVNIPDRGKQWRVRRGDIILRSRGADTAVAVVTEEPARETIVASPLLLIRVTQPEQFDPAYVAWELAQAPAQQFLEQHARGSMLRTVTKALLESTPLRPCPLARQGQIAEIAQLSAEVQRLTHELADKEAAYINTLLNH